MTSVRKRKMNKSSVGKATRRLKDKHRKINVRSNPIIAANWDYNATLDQNYKRLGLTVKLGKRAGGTEKSYEAEEEADEPKLEETDTQEVDESKLTEADIPKGEARIIRDENGEVVRVLLGTKEVDPEDIVYKPVKAKTEVVRQLEEYANRPIVHQERYQSEREVDWIEALYNKYKDDYEAMKWDKKLNVFQNSAGDLRRKVTKWKKANKVA